MNFFKKIIILTIVVVAAAGIVLAFRRAPQNNTPVKNVLFYRHPMRPEVSSPVPAKDEMGMDYIPVYKEELASSPVGGLATVHVSEEKQRLIGVKTAAVEKKELKVPIRAFATVAHDPELYKFEIEYLRTEQNSIDRTRDRTLYSKRRTLTPIEESTIEFKHMGLSEEWVKDLLSRGSPDRRLVFHDAGGEMWIYAQVYDGDALLIHPGDFVRMRTPAFQEREFVGEVRFVDTLVNPENRTVRVRILTKNMPHALLPNALVDAVIEVDSGEGLTVPEQAVFFSGTRQYVFVEKEKGVFEPRIVKIGVKTNGFYEVREGLAQGESVVVGANFLLDSESRLKSSLSASFHGEPS